MHNKIKHHKIPLVSSALGIGGTFLFSYLTFIPNQTFAAYDWETRKLSDITTMQEMNAKICENSAEHETKQLTDTRDNKTYWVAKLKDGNCWMTQNLDYDGGGIKQQDITKWNGTDINNTTAAYYDPGPYYYNGPFEEGWATHAQYPTACPSNTTGLSSCTSNGFSLTPGKATDDHDLVGNYYSWNAATNGTGGSITSGEASGSICPEGWKLPTSNNTNKGSFAYLLTQYGLQSSLTNGSYAIYSNPLYFVYGGLLYSGQLYNAGYFGRYWSSTPDSNADNAYGLNFSSSVNPFNGSNRYLGLSVRCLTDPQNYPEPPLDSDSQASVSITVSPVISIDVTKHADDMTVDFTQVARSSIIARVGSNQGYQVLISTEQSNLEQSPVVENQHIPMITTDQKISAGNKAWGISKDITVVSSTGTTISNPTIDTNTIYSPIGLGENKALFYTSSTPASEDLTFPVAIAVDSTLPSGQYSTQVTLTAVAM